MYITLPLYLSFITALNMRNLNKRLEHAPTNCFLIKNYTMPLGVFLHARNHAQWREGETDVTLSDVTSVNKRLHWQEVCAIFQSFSLDLSQKPHFSIRKCVLKV